MTFPALLVLALFAVGRLIQGAAAHIEDTRTRTGVLWLVAMVGTVAIVAIVGYVALDTAIPAPPLGSPR